MSDTPISPLAPEVSPLSEADPNSLNMLIEERITDVFNRPPLDVTDADLDVMVAYYHKERARFKLESAEKELKPKKPRSKKPPPTSVADALKDLEDSAEFL